MTLLSTRLARLGLGLAVLLGVAGAVPAHASASPPGRQVLSESTFEADTSFRGLRVQPFYVVPSDLDVHPEYQVAIDKVMAELQGWYNEQVGLTFQVAPVRTVRGSSYDSMRCGDRPSLQCLMDRTQTPNWWGAVNSLVPWEPWTTKVVFSQGGGGVVGSNLAGRFEGKAIVSDWVLEPISGLRDPRVIHCGYAELQCKGGVPKGTVAHELGHALGLHHPQAFEPGPLLMRWHGDYPNTGFLPHEKMILRNNPFFDRSAWSAGPWLDYGAPDEMDEGAIVDLAGTDLSSSDRVFFMHATGEIDATFSVGTTSARVRVPWNLGSGMFQTRRGTARGNGVPVNVVPQAGIPQTPTNVRATPISSSQIGVTWTDASDNEDGFIVFDGDQEIKLPGGTTAMDAGPYEAATWKCFMVRAYNDMGFSDWSDQACTRTLPATGWHQKSPMPTPRSLPAVAAVGGKVYAIGGSDANTLAMPTVEEYDPAIDAWVARRPMPAARHGSAAVTLDGKIYAIGGAGGDGVATTTVQRYDPATDTWSIRRSLAVARKYFAAAEVDGKIYVFGGFNANSLLTHDVEVYDPVSDTWTHVTEAPVFGSGTLYGSGEAIDGKVYLLGTYWGMTATVIYDVASNTFTTGTTMPTTRGFSVAAAVQGKVYAIGGYDADTGNALSVVEVYDPATNSWAAAAPMPTARDSFDVATIGSALFAVGGDNNQSRALATNEVYVE